MYTKTSDLTKATDKHYNTTHMQALHRFGALMTSSPWMSHHTRGSRQDIHSTRLPVRGQAVDGPDSLTPTSMIADQSTTTAITTTHR